MEEVLEFWLVKHNLKLAGKAKKGKRSIGGLLLLKPLSSRLSLYSAKKSRSSRKKA